MSVTVLTPASTFRLTTLDAVMAEISMQDQLVLTENLIDQASAAVAHECCTIFAQQAYREVQVGRYYRSPHLFLHYAPMVSVSSVSAGSTVITDYRMESASTGMLYRRQGWGLWHGEDDEWQIDYIAGYILPEQLTSPDPLGPELRTHAPDIERATIETIKVWFHEQYVDQRIESRRLGEQSISYGVQARHTGIPVLAKDLLLRWKRLRVA